MQPPPSTGLTWLDRQQLTRPWAGWLTVLGVCSCPGRSTQSYIQSWYLVVSARTSQNCFDYHWPVSQNKLKFIMNSNSLFANSGQHCFFPPYSHMSFSCLGLASRLRLTISLMISNIFPNLEVVSLKISPWAEGPR